MLKVIELFAGYRSQSLALRNIKVEYEVVGISEIDKYAIQAGNLIHKDNVKNFGDIIKIDEKSLPDCDLITYSFPCTDISLAGKQEGLSKGSGTRSGLLWECERIIEFKKPKYLLMENVKNLVGKKFKKDFDLWLDKLEELGYNSYWEVLNAKDYGIPQNRERVFVVSILKEYDKGYNFPQKQELKLKLKDILEESVDEKYYINNESTNELIKKIKNITQETIVEQRVDEGLRFFKNNICGSLRTIDSGGDKRVIEPIKIGNIYPKNGQNGNIFSEEGLCPTILSGTTDNPKSGGIGSNNSPKIITHDSVYRIRKLTPKECFRLMGLKDDDIDNLEGISNTQKYKLAGNSICVPVLEEIFKNLLK